MAKFVSDEKRGDIKKFREREAEDLAQILAKKYEIPYLNLGTVTIDIDALRIVPEEKARPANLAVFQKNNKKLEVAIFSPNLEATKNVIKELKRDEYQVNLYMVSETSLERAWRRYAEVPEITEIIKGIVEVSRDKLEEFIKQAETLSDLRNIFSALAGEKKVRKVSETLEIILAGAISTEASDIHIEPQENQIRLRFRLDGVLHPILFFNPKIYHLLLSRVKLVAGLKLNIHDEAQDGRFSIHIQDMEIEVRTSVVPGVYGESIVMRLLNPKAINLPLEDLGIHENLYKVLLKEIKKPNGMLLNTGPTGSGKTTTLYAILRKIYSVGIKIITLEDPVEYHLEGIVQTQIEENKEKEGYSFASGLRAILRQDPDVIMVGEIRDLDTAKTAMNAALTGHFVFSTLHTNDAAGTIPRLIDIGVNPNIIAPAINVSMAQRLVRKLCNSCKEKVDAAKEEKELITQVLSTFPKDYPVPKTDNLTLWRTRGCRFCDNIGYKGRIGIFEAILVDEKIEELILQRPSETEIWKAAKAQHILNMKQDGVLKVMDGTTSLDELNRIVGL